MTTANHVLTALGAALFALLGVWLALDPTAITGFYAIALNDAMAVTEIRAVFGGMMLGIGLGVLWLQFLRRDPRAACDVLLLILAGLLFARIVGFLNEGIPTGAVRNETIFEVALFCALAVTRARRLPPNPAHDTRGS